MTVRGLESFEVPTLLGLQNGTYVFTSRIYFVLAHLRRRTSRRPARWRSGCWWLAMIGVADLQHHQGGREELPDGDRQGFRPRPMRLGRWRPVMGGVIVLYFLVTVVLPLLVLSTPRC